MYRIFTFLLFTGVVVLSGCSEKRLGPRYEDRSLRRVAILDFTDNSRSVDAGSQLKHLMQREMFYRGMRLVDEQFIDEQWEAIIPLIEKNDFAAVAQRLQADMLILGQVDEFGYAKELGVRPSLVWQFKVFWGRDYPTVWTLPSSQRVHAASEGYMIDLAHRAVRMGVGELFAEIRRNPAFLIHHVPSDFIDQAFATRITEVPNLIVARPDPVLMGQGSREPVDPVHTKDTVDVKIAPISPVTSEFSAQVPKLPSNQQTDPVVENAKPKEKAKVRETASSARVPVPTQVQTSSATVSPVTAKDSKPRAGIDNAVLQDGAPRRREVKTTSAGTVAREYLKSGTLEREIPYDSQQRIHGTVVMYYDSGQVFAKMAYTHNRRHGESLYYYESGELRTKMVFEQGVPVSSTSYFESGKVKAVRNFKPQR